MLSLVVASLSVRSTGESACKINASTPKLGRLSRRDGCCTDARPGIPQHANSSVHTKLPATNVGANRVPWYTCTNRATNSRTIRICCTIPNDDSTIVPNSGNAAVAVGQCARHTYHSCEARSKTMRPRGCPDTVVPSRAIFARAAPLPQCGPAPDPKRRPPQCSWAHTVGATDKSNGESDQISDALRRGNSSVEEARFQNRGTRYIHTSPRAQAQRSAWLGGAQATGGRKRRPSIGTGHSGQNPVVIT